jgi:response regulator of citrate/malate metabolism
VLVVEDEALTAEAHAAYIGRLSGFVLVGSAATGQAALRQLAAAALAGKPIDLVLMDMNLPDHHGLDISRRMRAAGLSTDIIAITAVRELDNVRSAIAAGVVQYLIKPFTYATFAKKLTSYREFRTRLHAHTTVVNQSEVDQAFASLRSPTTLALPKGLADDTLATIVAFLQGHRAPLSASEVTEQLGMSRVTARRYLEYLADSGPASSAPCR